MRWATLGVLAFVATASLASERSGELCLDAHCRQTPLPAAIERAATPRPFTWWQDADRLLILGVVAPNAPVVSSRDALGKQTVRVTSRALDRWPTTATLQVQNAGGTQWRLDLSRRAVQAPLTLRLP